MVEHGRNWGKGEIRFYWKFINRNRIPELKVCETKVVNKSVLNPKNCNIQGKTSKY